MSVRKIAQSVLISIGPMLFVACGGYAPSTPTPTPPPNASARFALVANFSSNSISTCAVDSQTGQLSPKSTVPTGGVHARVMATDPSGHFAYVGNFGSNDISAFAINANTGALTAVGS